MTNDAFHIYKTNKNYWLSVDVTKSSPLKKLEHFHVRV